MEDIDTERERFGNELVEKCRKAAEERGEKFEVIEKVIPFTNDDVPKYLVLLERFEEESKKSSIMVGSYREKVA